MESAIADFGADDVDVLLDWLSDPSNLKDQYTPRIYCCADFHEKFGRLMDARDRVIRKQNRHGDGTEGGYGGEQPGAYGRPADGVGQADWLDEQEADDQETSYGWTGDGPPREGDEVQHQKFGLCEVVRVHSDQTFTLEFGDCEFCRVPLAELSPPGKK
jgi:hypothetical protein